MEMILSISFGIAFIITGICYGIFTKSGGKE